MAFKVLSATTDRAEWDSLFQRLPPPQLDVHFSAAYLRAQEALEGKGILAVLQLSGDHFIAQPFIKREIDGKFFDLTSAYGFGGPVTNIEPSSASDAPLFQAALSEWAREQSIVGEFCILHPLLFSAQLHLLAGRAGIQWTKDVIVIEDLAGFDLSRVSRHIRRAVKDAEAKGAIVRERPDAAMFDKFYNQGMDRLDAAPRWRRSVDYWREHNGAVGARWFWTAVNGVDRRALLTVGIGETAYAHFLGGDYRSRTKGLDEVTYYRAAIALALFYGFKRFHLGGGLTAGDTLEAFKASFSPVRYRVGSYYRVFLPAAYDTLTSRKKESEIEKYGRESAASWWPEYRREFA